MPNEIVVQAKNSAHRIQFTTRDWKLLRGPFVKGGLRLLALLGFNGTEPISVQRERLLRATEEVLQAISIDVELLQYDYAYEFGGYEKNPPHSSGTGTFWGFKIDGISKCVVVEPGHCYIAEFVKGVGGQMTWGNYIDLRNSIPVLTDDWGIITVRKRKKSTCWLDELPKLIDFLNSVSNETVIVQNRHH